MGLPKLCVSILLVITLAGCSSKIAYNNLDYLVRWYLSQYLELNDEQSPQVDIILDKALAWHRTNELPQYLAQLRELRTQILEQSMTQEQMAAHQERAFAHWVRVRKYLASDVSTIAMSLDTDQMSTLFVKLTKDREEEQADFAKRQSKQPDRAERIIESFAERMGYVTDAQADLVRAMAPKLMPTYQLWQDYQMFTQQKARRILIRKDFMPNAKDELYQLLLQPEALRSEEYNSAREHNRQLYLDLFSAIVPTLEAKQINQLVDEIDEYIELFEDLQQG
jgi:hypothetical protein